MATTNYHRMAKALLSAGDKEYLYYRLGHLEEVGLVSLSTLPFSIRVLLENALRNVDGYRVTEDDVIAVAEWNPEATGLREFPFMPGRVLTQDFTGVPAVVDLAAARAAVEARGGDPKKVNPLVPVDLVIDHSVQVDYFGNSNAFQANVERELERNRERYIFLRWAQKAFQNFSVVPPGTGIVHQVNLEYLSTVVAVRETEEGMVVFPDTLIGMDSHTTMVNGLSVLGWGVGGIEAEAVLLGQPYYIQLPQVLGFKLTGALREGVTATDLVLTITQMLRSKGVVGKFVEFYGDGLSYLSLPDRATVANMAPEYGATCGFFPIDEVTLEYLRGTGRELAHVALVEQYAKLQGLFRTKETPEPVFSDIVSLDMGDVEPSLAGPRRPQDRVNLRGVKKSFRDNFQDQFGMGERDSEKASIRHGAVVVAAITSCTSTSNPSVMVGAGLLAKKAVERGLNRKPWVKTSMAPGSQVVTDYINAAGLNSYLERLGFYTVGYGCTTCIGNSGPLLEHVSKAITDSDLVVAAVLSGNRNFEGRVHPEVKANYLASPMLVVAYALAGSVDVDLVSDPLGYDGDKPVYLKDIWPSQEEIKRTIADALNPEMFKSRYRQVLIGPEEWRKLPVPEGDVYAWETDSTYIKEVPFFRDLPMTLKEPRDILGARVLVMLGDSVTTDHISPAGTIPVDRPAGQYLIAQGVDPKDFNSFGSRRGNHDVMMRGTFGNIRLRNKLAFDKEGDWTIFLPSGEVMSIFEAAMKYQEQGTPSIVIAGKEYGAGSSRDWAAKGPNLLGVQAVLVEGYERIHRSNLIGMGVLPLQFREGEGVDGLGLTGQESFDIIGLSRGLEPRQEVEIRATRKDGSVLAFHAIVRIDTPVEVDYYRNGGVVQTVLRKML